MCLGQPATGLHLPTSDVDMVVLGIPLDRSVHQLYALQRAVEAKHRDRCRSHPQSPSSHNQIRRPKTGVHVDVCFEQQSGLSQQITSSGSDLPSSNHSSRAPNSSSQRGTQRTYSGGVGSFMLQMMIIARLASQHLISTAGGPPTQTTQPRRRAFFIFNFRRVSTATVVCAWAVTAPRVCTVSMNGDSWTASGRGCSAFKIHLMKNMILAQTPQYRPSSQGICPCTRAHSRRRSEWRSRRR